MQTELTPWMHLQVTSSAMQLMKKTCRQNSLPGCIGQLPHQPSSSSKKHANRTHWLGTFADGLISHPAYKKNMQTELTTWVHLQVPSSAIQLMKKPADRTHWLSAFAGGNISHPAHKKDMQTELTTWMHLQVASSAIQLMKKTCRQNSLAGCICRWPHQPSSS